MALNLKIARESTFERLNSTKVSIDEKFMQAGVHLPEFAHWMQDLVLCRHGEVYDFSISPAFESHLGR